MDSIHWPEMVFYGLTIISLPIYFVVTISLIRLRKLTKSFRTTFYTILLQHCIADILTMLTFIIFYLNRTLPYFRDLLYEYQNYYVAAAIYNSVYYFLFVRCFGIVFLSVHRYIVISTQRLARNQKIHEVTPWKIIVPYWIIPFLVSLKILINYKVSFSDPIEMNLVVQKEEIKINSFFASLVITSACLICAFSYGALFVFLKNHSLQISRSLKREIQLTAQVFLLFCAFLVMFTYFIANAYIAQTQNTGPIYLMRQLYSICNAILSYVNPFCIILFNKELGGYVKHLILFKPNNRTVMNIHKPYYFLLALLLVALASVTLGFPVGKSSNSSEEVTTTTITALEQNLPENLEEQLTDVAENDVEEEGEEEAADTEEGEGDGTDDEEENENQDSEEKNRKKRSMDSSARSAEEIELHHGIHKRNSEHGEHKKRSADHHNPEKRSENEHHEQHKRSEDHHKVKRHAEHHEEVHSTHHKETQEKEKRNAEAPHHVEKRSENHRHQKRSAVNPGEHSNHDHSKRNADAHSQIVHEDYRPMDKRSDKSEHQPHKRSIAEEDEKEMHDILAKLDAESKNHHSMKKREAQPEPGQKTSGHRQPRSSDQGIDEDDPDSDDDEDDNEENENRKKRNVVVAETDGPLPTFASDGEQHLANSVAVRRVKRVSRAGSSHKVRTLNKNRGNSKAGESQSDSSDTPSVPANNKIINNPDPLVPSFG